MGNPNNSPEWMAEDYLLAVLGGNPKLAGKAMRHFDEQRQGESDCIVVEGTQQDHELEGPQGYKVNVTIEYRAPITNDKQQNDSIVQLIRRSIETASLPPKFSEILLFHEDITGDRSTTKNLRRRSITIPVLIIL